MKVNPLTREVTLTENEYNDILYKNSSMKPVCIEELDENDKKEYYRLKEWANKTGSSATIVLFPDTENVKQFKLTILKF